jgi:hypothetical protein
MVYIKERKFLDQLIYHQLVKDHPTSWNYYFVIKYMNIWLADPVILFQLQNR